MTGVMSQDVPVIQSVTLDLPPSCVEFCPAHPNYFLVGTYNLEKDAGIDSSNSANTAEGPGEKKPQNRNGSILVFQLENESVNQIQVFTLASAITDLHFQGVQGRHEDCAVVSSTGTLSVFKLSPPHRPLEPLEHTLTTRIRGIGEDVLFLACAWHPSVPDIIAITTSTGNVHLIRLVGHLENPQTPCEPVITHTLEAWTVAFSPALERMPLAMPAGSPFTLYSGGDDSTLRFASCSLEDTRADGSAGIQVIYPSAKLDGHGAGVTAILPLPVADMDGSEFVVSGSYDDYVRVYSIQPLHQTYGVRRARLLAEENLGGGVWRLKLMDILASTDDETNDGSRPWRFFILASCMHAGPQIVEVKGNRQGECHIRVVGGFEGHKSMNYGSDFYACSDRTRLLCVSTSFYDKLLCLWGFQAPKQT